MKKNNVKSISYSGDLLRRFLKAQLKKKNITYAMLGKQLQVSEVAVKRWMTSQDIGLESLFRIAEVLEIDPLSLIDQGIAKEGLGREYTEEQEIHFAKHPSHLLVFIRALVGCPFSELAQASGVNPQSLIKILREMERLGLLLLLKEDKVKILLKGPFRWRKGGHLERTYFKLMKTVLFRHFENFAGTLDNPAAESFAIFRPFELYLDPDVALQLSVELANVLKKFRFISHSKYDKWAKTKPISGFIAIDQFDLWKAVLKSEYGL